MTTTQSEDSAERLCELREKKNLKAHETYEWIWYNAVASVAAVAAGAAIRQHKNSAHDYSDASKSHEKKSMQRTIKELRASI